jgi:phosphate transport system ATP-binding protein
MELKEQPRPVRRLQPGAPVTVVGDGHSQPRIFGHGALTPVAPTEPVHSPAQLSVVPVTAPSVASPAAPPVVSHGEVPREPAVITERMRVEGVSIAYGAKPAVKSVSLPIRQGEVLALIGPSGCGKTTLLRSLNRLTELTKGASLSGRITLDGDDITDFEATDLRRQVTMVFQQPNPFPMSIFDNIAYVLREQSRRRPGKRALRPAVEIALERAGLLEEVRNNLEHPALRLSGGQQQRLCIARALAANPEVLLLDEPCSALDPQSTAVIENLIVKLRQEVAVVIVTHNLQQARRIADHVAFMYLGELVEYAPAGRLFSAPAQHRTREYIAGAFG